MIGLSIGKGIFTPYGSQVSFERRQQCAPGCLRYAAAVLQEVFHCAFDRIFDPLELANVEELDIRQRPRDQPAFFISTNEILIFPIL